MGIWGQRFQVKPKKWTRNANPEVYYDQAADLTLQ